MVFEIVDILGKLNTIEIQNIDDKTLRCIINKFVNLKKDRSFFILFLKYLEERGYGVRILDLDDIPCYSFENFIE